MSLWIEASRDVEEERRIEAIAAANKALVDVHGIVMQASTAQEFEDRMAVVAERVEGVVASVTASSPMLFPIVHSAVLDGLSIDFDRVQEVRRAEQQRSAAKRAFFRRQRREASMSDAEVIAWARQCAERAGTASVTRVSGPDVLRLCNLAGQPDNETVKWARSCAQAAGDASVSRLSGPDLAKLCDMAEASKTASRTAALTCPKCKTPVNEGARIFDHGDHEVLKAKCPSCGWSGSKKKPKSKSATMHTAMTQSEADAVLAGVQNEEHRKALEKFVPYLVYGPSYNRGIAENFIDAIKLSNADSQRSFDLVYSKLEAGLDILNGGENNWYYDDAMGLYTKRLFGSITAEVAQTSPTIVLWGVYNDAADQVLGEGHATDVATAKMAVTKVLADWNIVTKEKGRQLEGPFGSEDEAQKHWERDYEPDSTEVREASHPTTAGRFRIEENASSTGATIFTLKYMPDDEDAMGYGIWEDVKSFSSRAEAEAWARDPDEWFGDRGAVLSSKTAALSCPKCGSDVSGSAKQWGVGSGPKSLTASCSKCGWRGSKVMPAKHSLVTASSDGLQRAAEVVAKIWGGEGSVIGRAEKSTIYLMDGPVDGTFVTIRSGDGGTYKVQDISGEVNINEVENYRPDPDRPGFWTWDVVTYAPGTYKVWSGREPLFHLTDLGGGRWQQDSGKIYTVASTKTSAEFPPKKKDEKKDDDTTDSDKDGEQDGPMQAGEQPEQSEDPATAPDSNGAQDQATPTPPTNDGQTAEEQTPSDPTMMDVGQTSSMSYTMADGGAGSIEVTFIREENGVYFFNGPTGEFGVGQQNGQWQDSAGNTFGFGGQQAPAPAQQAAQPVQGAPAQQPPQQQAPAQQAPQQQPQGGQPVPPKSDAPKDDSKSDDKKDDDKKGGPPWAK